MQRTSKMHSSDAPQSNEILPAQRSKEHLRHSAGKTCALSLERRSKVVKLLGSSGNSVKKKDAIKGPAVILGSSHTGSALVKALGNQGPINFSGWHTVQNNKYFSQQSLRGHVRQMHAWKPKWHGNMLLVHTSIHLGLFQDPSGYFPQQDFYSAIYCAVFPFAFTFYNGVTFDLLEHDMRSTIKPNKVHFGAISWLFIFLHFEHALRLSCLCSRIVFHQTMLLESERMGFIWTMCRTAWSLIFFFQFTMYIVSKQLYGIKQD